jgi:type I restriction enzyme, S subunit
MSTEVREPSAKYFVEAPYKQTDIGEIPSDWSITSLREATDAARPISYGIVQTGPNIDGGVPCIRVVDIDNGRLNTTGLICTSQAISAGYRRTLLQTGDLVMPLRGKVGDVAEVGPELEGANLTRGVALLSIRSGIVGSYCRQALAWSTTRRRLEQSMNGSALQEIPIAALRSFQIALPREEREQRAIATALSDVDALIAGLEKLIAKKRDLKQAAMQQLLTGQTRLPGFSGEWVVKRLGDHFTILKNGVNSRAELSVEGGVAYLHYGDIHGSKSLFLNPQNTTMPTLPLAKAKDLDRLQSGDLVFADASEDLDGVGKSVEVQGSGALDLVSGQHTIAIRFDKAVLADGFKAYLQFFPAFSAHLYKLAAGTKVYATNRSHIASAEIKLPDVDEQRAIASILLSMDTELSLLESRLAKTRELKQGMMQQLLTGRTRLV